VSSPLPDNRPALLVLHAEARRRRDRAALGSADFRAACEEISEIEVQIARVEQAKMPPIASQPAPTAKPGA
jgi:hypothetical protein